MAQWAKMNRLVRIIHQGEDASSGWLSRAVMSVSKRAQQMLLMVAAGSAPGPLLSTEHWPLSSEQ